MKNTILMCAILLLYPSLSAYSAADALRLKNAPEKVLPLGQEESSCRVLLRTTKSNLVKNPNDPFDGFGDAFSTLKFSVSLATATAKALPGGGPMQIVLPATTGKETREQIVVELDKLATRLGGWPKDCSLTIHPGSAEKGAAVDIGAIVALTESIVLGKPISQSILIADFTPEEVGPFNLESSLSKSQIIEIAIKDQPKGTRLLARNLSADDIGDITLAGNLSQQASIQFLGYDEPAEAAKLALAAPDSDLGKSMVAMDETNAVIQQRGAALLKNPHVQKRVVDSLAAWPKNLSAQFYKSHAKAPRSHFSKARSTEALERIASGLELGSGTAGQQRQAVKLLEKDCREHSKRCHPDAVAGFEAARAALRAWDPVSDEKYRAAYQKLSTQIKGLGGEAPAAGGGGAVKDPFG